MYIQDCLPSCLVHVDEGFVPQEAGVVHKNVHLAKSVDCSFYDFAACFTACAISYSSTTGSSDLIDDERWVGKVIYQNRCSELCKGKSVASTKTDVAMLAVVFLLQLDAQYH